jgi:hypothetical protein
MTKSKEWLSASLTNALASSTTVPHKMTEKIIKWLMKSQNHWGKYKMIEHYGKIQRMTECLSHRYPCLLHPCASQNDWENHKMTEEITKSLRKTQNDWALWQNPKNDWVPLPPTPLPPLPLCLTNDWENHKMTEKITKSMKKTQNDWALWQNLKNGWAKS